MENEQENIKMEEETVINEVKTEEHNNIKVQIEENNHESETKVVEENVDVVVPGETVEKIPDKTDSGSSKCQWLACITRGRRFHEKEGREGGRGCFHDDTSLLFNRMVIFIN